MEFFAVLPTWSYSNKKISIIDSDHKEIGYIQRNFKSTFAKISRCFPLSFDKTVNVLGEIDDCKLMIKEQSFKENLFKLKWDIYLQRNIKEMTFLLEDQTKMSTNPRMHYHKNAVEYIFKKDAFNRTCKVFIKDGDVICAEIKIEKLVPTHIKINLKTNDLTIIELLGIYYIIHLIY